MNRIQSGKELCDQFFETLKNKEDIAFGIVAIVRRRYIMCLKGFM